MYDVYMTWKDVLHFAQDLIEGNLIGYVHTLPGPRSILEHPPPLTLGLANLTRRIPLITLDNWWLGGYFPFGKHNFRGRMLPPII